MEDNFDNWLAEREKGVPEDDGRLLPGTVVGDYRIVALLGRGGFAEVYRASSKDGEPVAIKILHKLDDKSRARFVRESEILSQIKHRNIPRLLSFGSCGDRPYMVTELLKGYELPSSDRAIAKFLTEIMSAVEELHRHGFIHRDIKPYNATRKSSQSTPESVWVLALRDIRLPNSSRRAMLLKLPISMPWAC